MELNRTYQHVHNATITFVPNDYTLSGVKGVQTQTFPGTKKNPKVTKVSYSNSYYDLWK